MILNFVIKLWIIFVVFLINIPHADASQKDITVKGPVDPVILDVLLKSEKKYSYHVKVIFASGEEQIGYIFFDLNNLTFKLKKDNKIQKNTKKISNIKMIKFVTWKRKWVRGNIYLFSPITTEVHMRNNKILISLINNQLNRISFGKISEKPSKIYIYSIFYDSWKNKEWENSGKKSFKYPVTNPHKNTVVSIEFIKKNKQIIPNIIENFILSN